MSKVHSEGGPSRFEGEQHGWSPDVGEGGSERATEANEKAFGDPPEESGPGRVVSDEERSGVSATDTNAEPALGVGVSKTKRAEEYGAEGEEGHHDLGTEGESERPYGTSEAAGSTSVDPQDSTGSAS